MTKILYFITQSEFGGAQRYVFDLASGLSGEFETAVAMGRGATDGQLIKKLQERNVKYFIIPHLQRSISPVSDLQALREIIKLIKHFQPDIIHLNSSKISILGSIAALLAKSKIQNLKSKILYTVHGWVFNEPLPVWLKYFYLFAEKFTARWKDKIICVSEYDRLLALKHNIAPTSKLVTIHNGIPATTYHDKQQAKELLFSKIKNQKSKIKNILVGSIGNLYKTKSFEYLIEAADSLMSDLSFPRPVLSASEGRRESRFIIIGEGNQKKYLQSLIDKYHLQKTVILAGQIADAARLLPAFDLYVCSSVKEGLPYSILEAMAAGLPIISTGVGGIPEMIEHEKTGLLVKPDNAEDLAEKIKTVINNKALAQELGRRAQARAAAEFSLEKMIEATKKIYG